MSRLITNSTDELKHRLKVCERRLAYLNDNPHIHNPFSSIDGNALETEIKKIKCMLMLKGESV